MSKVITLTGPSGAGKSTLIREILKCNNAIFNPVVIPKYTTRPPRQNEINTEKDVIETISIEKLPISCDLVYEQYGVRYGLELSTIYQVLSEHNSPIVILNDVRAVEDIRMLFGPIVCSIFLFRESPSFAKHKELAIARGADDEESARTRFEKAQGIYRIYIENIHLFDHVILNHGSRDDLLAQIEKVVSGFIDENCWPLESVI